MATRRFQLDQRSTVGVAAVGTAAIWMVPLPGLGRIVLTPLVLQGLLAWWIARRSVRPMPAAIVQVVVVAVLLGGGALARDSWTGRLVHVVLAAVAAATIGVVTLLTRRARIAGACATATPGNTRR